MKARTREDNEVDRIGGRCEHYWQRGILRVERGEPDPHRDTCPECQRAHEERAALIRALPRIGAESTEPPRWQAEVWDRIARDETARARRVYWLVAALVAACALALLWLLPRSDGSIAAERPRIEVVSGPLAVRSTSARVGDRVRISVAAGQEVRVYRADRLVLRCRVQVVAPGCVPDPLGLVAEAELTTAGEYQLVRILSQTADPAGSLDRDLAAVVTAGGAYRVSDLSVR